MSFLLEKPKLLEKKFISRRIGALNKINKNNRNQKYSFNKSNNYFSKVEKTIPLASQTFSKSFMQYSKECSSTFCK